MKIKLLICFSALLLFTSCKDTEIAQQQIEIDGTINVSKTEIGFNIYSNTGELILEFTEINTDSASLETLDLIYETAKEFYNQLEPKEEIINTIKI